MKDGVAGLSDFLVQLMISAAAIIINRIAFMRFIFYVVE
jgi:hypothetical protein